MMERWVQAETGLPFEVYVTGLFLRAGAWYLSWEGVSPIVLQEGEHVGVTFPRALSRAKPFPGEPLSLLNVVKDEVLEVDVVTYHGFVHFGDDYVIEVVAQ